MFGQLEIKKENVWRLHDGDCLYCTSGSDWYNPQYPMYGASWTGGWRCGGRSDMFFRQHGWHDGFDWDTYGNTMVGDLPDSIQNVSATLEYLYIQTAHTNGAPTSERPTLPRRAPSRLSA